MTFIDKIQAWFNGHEKRDDPELSKALEASQQSLEKAIEVSAEVEVIVTSIKEEGERNHFIELAYQLKGG